MKQTLSSSVQFAKGVGEKRAETLAAAGIETMGDMLMYFPRDYIDRRALPSIKRLREIALKTRDMFGDERLASESLPEEVAVAGVVAAKKKRGFGRGKLSLAVTIKDEFGATVKINFWNYAAFYDKNLQIGDKVFVSGKFQLNKYDGVVFNHPKIEKIDAGEDARVSGGEILPKYSISDQMRAGRISQNLLRNIVANILDSVELDFEETLPDYLLEKYDLPPIVDCIRLLHFPDDSDKLARARYRVKFEEMFYYQLSLNIERMKRKTLRRSPVFDKKSEKARALFESLPFELTGDQKRVLREIDRDFRAGSPMNRLLQGDVGSGKTIVAAFAILMAIENDSQTAIIAPTEILAEQHYQTMQKYLKPLGVEVVQLVGGQKARLRRDLLEKIASGFARVIVGTHALFQSEIAYNNLGFLVVDEQHRFGVEQRAKFKELAKDSLSAQNLEPHTLVMTATPIPRTLSMTLYGELDVSFIREKPKNRLPAITRIAFEKDYDSVYDFVKKQISKGGQAFIVYPFVEKSEKVEEVKSAIENYERLKTEIFPGIQCGLLHGQMLWYEKEEAMSAFSEGEYDVLIATTVVEVGIDVPNATVMIIENAERFGLSQLHQLRGRVGRGSEQSYCILIAPDKYERLLAAFEGFEREKIPGVVRLKAMEEINDGFKIADIDLKLRGPGDMLGTKQSGLPDFRYVNIVEDGELIAIARRETSSILDEDPHLRAGKNLPIRRNFLEKIKAGRDFFGIA